MSKNGSLMVDKIEEKVKTTIQHPNTPEQQVEIQRIMSLVDKMYELQSRTWAEFLIVP